MTQEEDVLLVDQKAVPGKERAELAHLVPENGVVPVIDVEVVVLDVGEHGAGEGKLLVECLSNLLGKKGAMLVGDPVAFGDHLLAGA